MTTNALASPQAVPQTITAANGFPLTSYVGSYGTVEEMIRALRPSMPVHCHRSHTISTAAKWFLNHFQGDVLYSVKSNPEPLALKELYLSGVHHFDVASLAEVELIAGELPDVEMYFMHPVKSREAIMQSYFNYGIRTYSLDSMEELNKILEETGDAGDLNLYVRIAIPNENAAYSLSGKFGIGGAAAVDLLKATDKVAARIGVCFHVGSQCMNADDYTKAITLVDGLVREAGILLDGIDVGGGFPSIYPGMTPPALSTYMDTIRAAVKMLPLRHDHKFFCEPGRALVAESGSVLVRVELRKGDALYLNDGIYGSLFDAGLPAFRFPVRGISAKGPLTGELKAFSFFGPTCDSLDAMKGPFMLPADIAEGDYIEIGQMGAYGATMRTNFNGFYANQLAQVDDAPLLSLF